jgi:hypothetical protein
MLRLAAAAGRQEAVTLLLGEFGGQQGGPRSETCLRAVLRGAVHAGQVALLQVRVKGHGIRLLVEIRVGVQGSSVAPLQVRVKGDASRILG